MSHMTTPLNKTDTVRSLYRPQIGINILQMQYLLFTPYHIM